MMFPFFKKCNKLHRGLLFASLSQISHVSGFSVKIAMCSARNNDCRSEECDRNRESSWLLLCQLVTQDFWTHEKNAVLHGVSLIRIQLQAAKSEAN